MYSRRARFSSALSVVPQVCPALLLPGLATSIGVPIRFASSLSLTNPTFAASKRSSPRQNCRGRLSTGSSRSASVGTDPLCRYGAVSQIPSSGTAV